MLQVRAAVNEDKSRIRELWRLCFGDSERFMDWFFAERYFPEFSSVLLEDGVIMSALQSYPLHIRLRGQLLPASMLAGVSTHPERNGRGYMKQIFLHYMQRVRALGIPVAIHTPANLPVFFSRGHYPAADVLHAVFQQAQAEHMPPGITPHSLYENLAPLQACYQHATRRYSGCVSRTMGDFAFKCRDYAADGAKCFVRQIDDVHGYCVYYVMEDRVYAEECFALDDSTLNMLADALRYEAGGRKLDIKLPPDTALVREDAALTLRPQGVMGVADLSALLRTVVGNPAYVFEVTDTTVPENAGVWDGAGNASRRAPHIRLEAGRLGQFLGGYRTLGELAEAGEAEVLDADAVQALDCEYPKQVCFITDEY